MSKKQWIGLVLAFVLFVTIILIPDINHLEAEGQRCLALFVAVFVLYIFESIPAAVISIAMIPLLVILKVADITEALAGFASTSTYLVIGSFILAGAMIKTGLGKRITCHLLLLIGTGPVRISLGLMVVNIIMAFLIPSSTARTAMLLPICLSIIHEYHGEKKEKVIYAANLLLTLCVTSSTISAGILTSTISNPMATEYIKNTTSQVVSYGEWFLWGFPPALFMTFLSWLIIQIVFRLRKAEGENGPEYLQQQLAGMGKLDFSEIFTAIDIAITVILWVSGSYLGIDSTAAALVGAVLLFLPMCPVLEWKDCQVNISLSVVFIISGGISLGNAMARTGTSDWLADQVFGFLSDNISLTLVIIISIVVVQFMHVFFVGTATMANAFFPILISIAVKMEVNPLCIIMPAAFMIGGYPVLMFFNTTPNILCYDTGFVKSSDFVKTGIPISVAACIIYAICVEWYWPMVGML
ncbi:MAG: anion permease [Bacteroides sp.]|nr:anion permease [Bacteroides sp.]MCM1549125.1 anion permease [Clostridium sp.]